VYRERVRDLLGRPAGAASDAFHELRCDANGQGYITNALAVKLQGPADFERVCGVITGRRRPAGGLSSLADDDNGGYPVGPLTPSTSSEDDLLKASGHHPDSHGIIILTFGVRPGGDPDPADPTPRVARLYFVDLAAQDRAPWPAQGAPSPSPGPSPRSPHIAGKDVLRRLQPSLGPHAHARMELGSLDKVLRVRRAAKSAFEYQAWEARGSASNGGAGGVLPALLREALSPWAQVAVLGSVCADDPNAPDVHIPTLSFAASEVGFVSDGSDDSPTSPVDNEDVAARRAAALHPLLTSPHGATLQCLRGMRLPPSIGNGDRLGDLSVPGMAKFYGPPLKPWR
jgi:hypothetical protein